MRNYLTDTDHTSNISHTICSVLDPLVFARRLDLTHKAAMSDIVAAWPFIFAGAVLPACLCVPLTKAMKKRLRDEEDCRQAEIESIERGDWCTVS